MTGFDGESWSRTASRGALTPQKQSVLSKVPGTPGFRSRRLRSRLLLWQP